MIEQRCYRVVRLVERDRYERWCVVSYSLRDDDTWDVIAGHQTKSGALAHVDDFYQRQRVLQRAGLG